MSDGGPAFPHPIDHARADMACPRCSARVRAFGMSLRDYFAAKALASLAGDTRGVLVALTNQKTLGGDYSDLVTREATLLAVAAYCIADAMLKEREK